MVQHCELCPTNRKKQTKKPPERCKCYHRKSQERLAETEDGPVWASVSKWSYTSWLSFKMHKCTFGSRNKCIYRQIWQINILKVWHTPKNISEKELPFSFRDLNPIALQIKLYSQKLKLIAPTVKWSIWESSPNCKKDPLKIKIIPFLANWILGMLGSGRAAKKAFQFLVGKQLRTRLLTSSHLLLRSRCKDIYKQA